MLFWNQCNHGIAGSWGVHLGQLSHAWVQGRSQAGARVSLREGTGRGVLLSTQRLFQKRKLGQAVTFAFLPWHFWYRTCSDNWNIYLLRTHSWIVKDHLCSLKRKKQSWVQSWPIPLSAFPVHPCLELDANAHHSSPHLSKQTTFQPLRLLPVPLPVRMARIWTCLLGDPAFTPSGLPFPK